jgi:hypothetical protein
MIKFFRRIRFDLMETGKTGRYFKYAIGEIVLVVVATYVIHYQIYLEQLKLFNIDAKEIITAINMRLE